MNDEKLFQARNNLYLRMASRLIKAFTPFLGQKPNAKRVASVSRPFVVAARTQAQNIAYQDYVKFVNNQDPVAKMEQNRFTDELWSNSVERSLEDADIFGADQIEEIAMSADYWARDAEWGQRVDVAKKDPRIDKVARVDFKPPTCPYCTLLNSRGAVYLSTESAARTLHNGDTCTLVFVKKGDRQYPGHQSTLLAKERYNAAKDKLGSAANTTTILAELKKQDPDRPIGSVRKNVQDSVRSVTASKVKEAKARIAALEKLSPTSESAIKYRDEQLSRNKDLLKALEGTTSNA